jgi:hypothetical protein
MEQATFLSLLASVIGLTLYLIHAWPMREIPADFEDRL